MITCKNCGSIYSDDATYCNRCNINLDAASAVNLFDQQEIIADQQLQQRTRTNIVTLLFVLCLLFPFLVYFDLIYFMDTGTQRILIIITVELLGLAAIAGVKKSWRRARLVYGVLAGLLLPLFPAGTVLAFVLFYQLIKRDW